MEEAKVCAFIKKLQVLRGSIVIPLLDTFGKLFDSIICARLQTYIETGNCLAEVQFGFQRARSTTDAIAMINSIAENQLPLKATTTTTA